MVENASIQQLILESEILLYVFNDVAVINDDITEPALNLDTFNQYFELRNIENTDFFGKLECLFMLFFNHIKSYRAVVTVEKLQEIFNAMYWAKEEVLEDDIANKTLAVDSYSNLLAVLGYGLENAEIPVVDKIALLDRIDPNGFLNLGATKKIFLYSLLNLLISNPELDINRIRSITEELKLYL